MRRAALALLGFVGLVGFACGGSDDSIFMSDQQRGQKGQACFENGTCFAPFTCVSSVCVDLSEVQGGHGGGAGEAGQGGDAGAGGQAGAGAEAGQGGDAGAGGQAGAGAEAGQGGDAGAGAEAGQGGGGACVGVDHPAVQPPASFLFVVDRSSSMRQGTRWKTLVEGLVRAVDEDIFDGMRVGLLLAPAIAKTAKPACTSGPPEDVSCGASAPSIPLTDTGTEKSSGFSGVRSDLKTTLGSTEPVPETEPDAMPLYASIAQALSATKLAPEAKRLVLVLSDGSPGCNGDTGRTGFGDCSGCATGWEDPTNVAGIVGAARKNFGIETMVIGLPGSAEYDPNGCSAPPYAVPLAFSAIAYAGSTLATPGCTGATFFPGGGIPTVPCHRDLAKGADAVTLAKTLVRLRTAALGCAFDLPPGADPTLVNLTLHDGAGAALVPRRASPQDECEDAPCWDFVDGPHAALLGKACAAYLDAAAPKVTVSVGCPTTSK